jgi:hypothetical protein
VSWLVTQALKTGALQPTWHGVPWLVLAVALNAGALAMMGERFAFLARHWPITDSRAGLASLSYRSLFWLFVLPFGIGMEAARYLGLRALAPGTSRSAILTCVLADRALGFAAALPGAGLGWWLVGGHVGWLVATIAMIVPAAWVAARFVPPGPATLLAAFGRALVFHALTYAAIWSACAGLDIDIGIGAMLFAVAAGVIGAVLPIALFGVQAGDFATAGLLAWLGTSALIASMVAAVTWASRLQGALTGAVLELGRTGSLARSLWVRADSDGSGG